MFNNKIKLLVVGPTESGKSFISNFIADATEAAGGKYHPTQGVRILEFEVDNIDTEGGHTESVEIELWDCSGDQRFEMCWPSMQKDAHGVIFVYNPAENSHESEMEKWHLHFAKEQGLRDRQCLVMAHLKPGHSHPGKVKLSNMNRIRTIVTSVDEDPESIRSSFNLLIGDVLTLASDRREQEELSIIE